MSNEEKILLIKLILEDIRGNWGWENGNRDAEAYNKIIIQVLQELLEGRK